jgi:hypothetical protein
VIVVLVQSPVLFGHGKFVCSAFIDLTKRMELNENQTEDESERKWKVKKTKKMYKGKKGSAGCWVSFSCNCKTSQSAPPPSWARQPRDFLVPKLGCM